MSFQVLGKLDFAGNAPGEEILLGCIRIDEQDSSESDHRSGFAFYAFSDKENVAHPSSFCSLQGPFLAISENLIHKPTQKKPKDVLFIYATVRDDSAFKFLIPGPAGQSKTGTIVHGEEAIKTLFVKLKK